MCVWVARVQSVLLLPISSRLFAAHCQPFYLLVVCLMVRQFVCDNILRPFDNILRQAAEAVVKEFRGANTTVAK